MFLQAEASFLALSSLLGKTRSGVSVTSSFSWLDFSDFERRRALEVISRLAEHDTVDELGIGSVRDALSEILFPATSVIHTRARYFFFVPWIYLKLEEARVSSDKIASAARKAELGLIEVLLASDDSEGTIGSRARQGLKILPSAIYWAALHRLGIRSFRGTRDRYHRSLDRFYMNRALSRRNRDEELVERFRTSNWDQHLPSPPSDFPTAVSLTLRKAEAEYLRERIVFSAPKTLYRYLVETDDPVAEADFPWEYPAVYELPTHVQEELHHAQNFSEIMHGAALLYNLMLAQLDDKEDKIAEYKEWLADWREECGERWEALDAWDTRRFWEIASMGGTRILPTTKLFIESWINLSRTTRGKNIVTNKTARDLILFRERQLKKDKSRLDNKRAREAWTGYAGVSRLVFRWEIARQMLSDIEVGLNP